MFVHASIALRRPQWAPRTRVAAARGPRRDARARILALLTVVIAVIVVVWPRAARAEPGDELAISVLTFGPGDHPFSKFGHDGLLVEDKVQGTSLVYNYGTYSFHSAWLIPKFLLGKYRYWLSVSPLGSVIASYAAENRSVTAQRLALTPAQKLRLSESLAWNALEENKYYLFDYYRDNCATRVRDLVDGTTDGALHLVTGGPATFTWREHTERLAADDPLVYLGLDLAMGGFIDQPISFWDEMFLPAKLQEGLRRAEVGIIDENGSPVRRRLVEAENVLVPNRRPPLRDAPPVWTTQFLASGSVTAFVLIALGFSTRMGLRPPRAAFGILLALFGTVLGALGSLFLFLWIFTNHEVAYHNENLFQCAPFALGLGWYGLGVARGQARAALRAHTIALAGFGCAAAGLLFKVLPWFSQKNGHLIAFFLPLWAGLALATWLAARSNFDRARRDSDGLATAKPRGIE